MLHERMTASGLLQLLWIIGILSQALLGVVLVWKRAWRPFPLFVAYFASGLFASIFIYFIRHRAALYFYSYWVMESIGIILGFAVVYEIFKTLFSGHLALRKLALVVFRCVLVALFGLGIVVLAKNSSIGFASITSAVLIVEEAARIIEVGLLICLFLLSTAFGLHWRQHIFGIAVGLGIFISIELITVMLRTQMGLAVHDALNLIRILGFNVSVLVWIGYFLAPERSPSEVELPQRSQLEQWNQAVMELIRQ
jgi:hypothetical protein